MPQSNEQKEKAKIWGEMDRGAADPGSASQLTPEPVEKIDAATISIVNEVADPTTSKQSPVVADDPYKDLPDHVRHEILGLKTMLTKSQRDTDGRIGGLMSEVKRLREAQPAPGTPSAAELRDANGNPAKMAKLVSDYPEFGDTMKGALDEALRPLQDQVKTLLERDKPTAEPVTHAALQRMRDELAVDIKHPGWLDEVRTPQFAGWLESQDDAVKALAVSDKPADAIRLLDLRRGPGENEQQDQTQRRLSAAAAIPSGRGSTMTRAKPVEQMSKAELWAHLDQIDKQKA